MKILKYYQNDWELINVYSNPCCHYCTRRSVFSFFFNFFFCFSFYSSFAFFLFYVGSFQLQICSCIFLGAFCFVSSCCSCWALFMSFWPLGAFKYHWIPETCSLVCFEGSFYFLFSLVVHQFYSSCCCSYLCPFFCCCC